MKRSVILKIKIIIKRFLEPFNRDFAWKVRQRVQYDKNPLFIILLDKYKVKEYARSKGVQTAKLFYVTDDPDTIPFNELPSSCLIKANHGCGWNILYHNSEFYMFGHGGDIFNSEGALNKETAEEYKLSKEACISSCREWLSQKYSEEEWAYHHIVPQIIVEEVLLSADGGELKDYRMYTFRGKVKAINIGSPQYRKNNENVFLKPDWKMFKLTRYREKLPHPLPKKPDNLEQMIAVAESLGEALDFARVDLYNTTKGVVLGEMTIYPEGGTRGTPTSCPKFNRWLGKQWA